MGSSVAGGAPADTSQTDEDLESLLVALRSTLGEDDETRLRGVEYQLKSFQHQAQSQVEALQGEARDLRIELERLRRAARDNENLVRDLQNQIYILNHRMHADGAEADGLLGMSDLIRRTVLDSRDDMAEALGPVMGEAIRVQIRDSRQDMVEALYPVIGESVQRSVVEAFRELQRNIDARLKAVLGPRSVWRTFGARLRGVSPAQLALRDALPFAVQTVFLIQHGSGLLLAHSHTGEQVADSDLVGGMLTAIRDFVRDSFGQADKELDEIQYGNQRIVVQSGQIVYLAVLIQGIEPEGFRAKLHDFVSDLHVRHARSLREYSGDPSTLPDLQPKLDRLVVDLANLTSPRSAPLIGRRTKIGAGLIGLLLIAVACFYLQFTIALLPVAFPGPTATPTATLTVTPTATHTLAATAVVEPTATPAPTTTPVPLSTTTVAPTPTAMTGSLPVTGITSGNVWVRPLPDRNAPLTIVLLKDTPVRLVSVYGPWAELEWSGALGLQRGWVPLQWVATLKSIPPEVVTPFPTSVP
jgi:hypothetical protein